ncbi:uncharacterized protein LOC144291522 [Canis aureus]
MRWKLSSKYLMWIPEQRLKMKARVKNIEGKSVGNRLCHEELKKSLSRRGKQILKSIFKKTRRHVCTICKSWRKQREKAQACREGQKGRKRELCDSDSERSMEHDARLNPRTLRI